MQVTLRLRPDEALAWQTRQRPSPAMQELVRVLGELGAELTPIHPGATDPLLAPYFTVDIEDMADIDNVLRRLQKCSVVEAAYVKPLDEAPSG